MNRYSYPLVQRLQASLRDTFLLFREFFWPVVLYTLLVVGGGFLYYQWSFDYGEPLDSLAESFYFVISLTFFQPTIDFPHEWHLQAFFFLMPPLGLFFLAQGVADFGALLFNRRSRDKEWEMAVASTFHDHIILIGLGHLGYQVTQQLLSIHQDIVVIELKPQTHLLNEIREYGVPILIEDANQEHVLEAAGVEKAKAIMLCTQNDSLNLQIAVKARSLKPDIDVVVRIFDNDFAEAIQRQFGYHALSSSAMSAPAFAAAAAGMQITQPIGIEGHELRLLRLIVSPRSKLKNKTVEVLEQKYDISIVLLEQNGNVDMHPPGYSLLNVGNSIAILASNTAITEVLEDNR